MQRTSISIDNKAPHRKTGEMQGMRLQFMSDFKFKTMW